MDEADLLWSQIIASELASLPGQAQEWMAPKMAIFLALLVVVVACFIN